MNEPSRKQRVVGVMIAVVTISAGLALWLGTCTGRATRNAETVIACIEDHGGQADEEPTDGRSNITSLIVGRLNGVEFEVRDYRDYSAAVAADGREPVGHLVRRQGDILVIQREPSDERTARLIADCGLVPR